MEIHVLGRTGFNKSLFMLSLGQVLSVSHKVGVVTKDYMPLTEGSIEVAEQLFLSEYSHDLPEDTQMRLYDVTPLMDYTGTHFIFFTDSNVLSMKRLMEHLTPWDQLQDKESFWVFAELFQDSSINEKYMRYYFKQYLTRAAKLHTYHFDEEDMTRMIEQQHDEKLQCYQMSKGYIALLCVCAGWLTDQEPKVLKQGMRLIKRRRGR